MRDCEIDVKDSTIINEKVESIDCAVTAKEEEYEPQTAISLDTFDVPQNLLITGIVPNAIKIKSEPSDQDNVIENRIEMIIDANTDTVDLQQNFSRNRIVPIAIKNNSEPREQDNVIETSINYKKSHKYEICNGRLITKRCLLTYTKPQTLKKCDICNRTFTRNQDLLRHIETHSDDKNLTCKICNKRLTNKLYLLRHVKAHANDKTDKCNTGNKCFPTNGHLLHNNERNHKCKSCTKSFATKRCMLRHAKVHTVQKNYKCGICEKCFVVKEYLSKHVKRHVGEKKFKCETCGKSFMMNHDMLRHKQTHTGEKNHECTICNKRFRRKETVMNHMKIHAHEDNDEIYGWSFGKGKITSRRKITHREESGDEVTRNFPSVVPTITTEEINEIGKTFIKEEIDAYVKENDLESDNHEMEIDVKDSTITRQKLESMDYDVTVKEEGYQDASVPLTAITLDAVDALQNISNTEIAPNGIEIKSEPSEPDNENEKTSIDSTKYKKPYDCEISNESFLTKYHLLTHIKTHTHKNFKCDFCNKSFVMNQNLLRHIQTHTGERNSKCEICNRCFATKYNMLQHMKVHHDEKNYKCEICSECFTTNKVMSWHRRLHDGG